MPPKKIKVILAQINPVVGDLTNNSEKIIQVIKNYRDADLIVFPEMSLVGYPLMDHIFDPIIQARNKECISQIRQNVEDTVVIFGSFTESEEIQKKVQKFYNSAIVIKNKEIIHIENKRLLPNYDIFDERRYFSFDNKYKPITINGKKAGILICEDLWDENYDTKVAQNLVENGAQILIIINASPYYIGKFDLRKELVSKKATQLKVPVIYVNMVGGLDEIVFDGRSFISDIYGKIIFVADTFKEDIASFDLNIQNKNHIDLINETIRWEEEVIEALKLNLSDYYHKSGIFKGIVVGLSGGIDSAFTAYICAQALGPELVHCIMLPTRFTSQESLDYAKKLCENIGMKYYIHPIDELFEKYEDSIQDVLGEVKFDIADENLQARIRATLLMYYSNKFDWLLVSTGNKSEIAVGYCTLYGDTNGGKNIPGDLFKVQIYDICNFINQKKEIIPKGIIERPPSAELRENQKDSDSLPPYEVLDTILREIIIHGIGSELEHLQRKGINSEEINRVRKLYLNSEFKRKQLVQTIKVSPSAFGIGRRYPVLKRIKLK